MRGSRANSSSLGSTIMQQSEYNDVDVHEQTAKIMETIAEVRRTGNLPSPHVILIRQQLAMPGIPDWTELPGVRVLVLEPQDLFEEPEILRRGLCMEAF